MKVSGLLERIKSLNLKAILSISVQGSLAVRHLGMARPILLDLVTFLRFLVLDSVSKVPKMFLVFVQYILQPHVVVSLKLSRNTAVNTTF